MNKDLTTFHKTSTPIFSVSQLNQLAQTILESEIGQISVRGEISNLVMPTSGHSYFSLKDKKSQLRCAMFRNKPGAKGFKPENGLEVVANGLTSVYPIRGEYQLIVDSLELSGDGVLRTRFETLKAKLEKAGLFDEETKKEIPPWPKTIGLITSPTGAAIKDILIIIKRRCAAIPIIIYPCSVQGQGAATEIAQTIDTANQRKECDVLILSRGGGSLEDLWPFNEEVVARAIYSSTIPIVSGIGHQIDLTISDLAADLRAPTPSTAAELVTPDMDTVLNQLESLTKRLLNGMRFNLKSHLERTKTLSAKFRHPKRELEMGFQRTDDLFKRLVLKIEYYLQLRRLRYRHLLTRAQHLAPKKRHHQFSQEVDNLARDLRVAILRIFRDNMRRRDHLLSRLNNLGHARTMARGYSIVRDQNGKLIKDTDSLTLNQKVSTTFSKGHIASTITAIDHE